MSDKFSARNSHPSSSPLRSNTFVVRGKGGKTTATTSRRTAVKKTGEKITDDKKTEPKNYRDSGTEEFGNDAGLNLTLVGSPAPRSQVRRLVSSAIITAAKSKGGTTRRSHGSKLRETNTHEICMEKLYQFADNPTKFVRNESRDLSELKLDLDFSERSDEPEDYYDSHNIAFGENGEYRIPEYDHIRFLQFSVNEPRDPYRSTVGEREDSASVKFDRSTERCVLESANEVDPSDRNSAADNQTSVILQRTVTESQGSLPVMEGSVNDFLESGAQIAEFVPWNTRAVLTPSHSGTSPVVDGVQTYPLGSAINYKNNINPEVEKFMLDLGPELCGSDEQFGETMTGNRLLLDGSILSRNFAEAMRLQTLGESTENSLRTSPRTSRTTLSQGSSSDGTWHGHSLNSPYFASKESNSRTDSKRNVDPESPEAIPGYEEADEYLMIVKNVRDSGPSSEEAPEVKRYIFITDQIVRTPESHNNRRGSESLATESENHFSGKSDRLPSMKTDTFEDKEKDNISSGESTSDYCISKIFHRSSSSSTASSSSSSSSSTSSSTRLRQTIETEKTETRDKVVPANAISPEVEESDSVKDGPDPKILYMTLEEVNLAADYTTKLSQLFNRVLKRSENKNHQLKNPKIIDDNRSSVRDVTSKIDSKLIRNCLASSNFCTSHSST